MNLFDKLKIVIEGNHTDISDKISEIIRTVMEAHEGGIFQSEMDKVRTTRMLCAIAAVDAYRQGYPFPNDETAIEAIRDAIINKSSTPNLTETVRFLLEH
jgi:hypothetical protein